MLRGLLPLLFLGAVGHPAAAEPMLRLELKKGVVAEKKFDNDTEAVVPRLLKLPPDDALFTEFVWIPKAWLVPRTWTVSQLLEQGSGSTGTGAVVRKALEGVTPQADLVTRAAGVMALLRASPAPGPAVPASPRLRPLWQCLAEPAGASPLDPAFHTMAVMSALSPDVALARIATGGPPAVVTLVPGAGAACAPTDDPRGRCALGGPGPGPTPLHIEASWGLTEVAKPGWSPFSTHLPSAGTTPWLTRQSVVCEQARSMGLECVERTTIEAQERSSSTPAKDSMYLLLSGVTGLFLLGGIGKLVLDARRRRSLRDQRQAEQRSRRF